MGKKKELNMNWSGINSWESKDLAVNKIWFYIYREGEYVTKHRWS